MPDQQKRIIQISAKQGSLLVTALVILLTGGNVAVNSSAGTGIGEQVEKRIREHEVRPLAHPDLAPKVDVQRSMDRILQKLDELEKAVRNDLSSRK